MAFCKDGIAFIYFDLGLFIEVRVITLAPFLLGGATLYEASDSYP